MYSDCTCCVNKSLACHMVDMRNKTRSLLNSRAAEVCEAVHCLIVQTIVVAEDTWEVHTCALHAR